MGSSRLSYLRSAYIYNQRDGGLLGTELGSDGQRVSLRTTWTFKLWILYLGRFKSSAKFGLPETFTLCLDPCLLSGFRAAGL